MQFEYGYDNIGNRTNNKAGGNDLGSGLRQSNYTANSLNQYTQRTVPGAIDVIGTAASGATVAVNNQAVYRKGDYFQKELSVSNASAPVYQQVDVVGAKNSAGAGGEDAVANQGGRVYVPAATESYAYDFDGNLTSDGRWTYVWDGENRLVSMTANASAPVEAKKRLEFAYDYMGRRIEKKVYGWNAGTAVYQLESVARFVYDGWNLMAELDGVGALKRSYVWGQDVSGTLQGAGGIGGLLLVNESGGSHQVGYDGSGNVTTLVRVSNGALSASYEYDGFGNILRMTGEMASQNVFRFSTKYTDEETGLVYYGYRYYQPLTGRWISQDPINEIGTRLLSGELNADEDEPEWNLYSHVRNQSLNRIDVLGLWGKLTRFVREIEVRYRNDSADLLDIGENCDIFWVTRSTFGQLLATLLRPGHIA